MVATFPIAVGRSKRQLVKKVYNTHPSWANMSTVGMEDLRKNIFFNIICTKFKFQGKDL